MVRQDGTGWSYVAQLVPMAKCILLASFTNVWMDGFQKQADLTKIR